MSSPILACPICSCPPLLSRPQAVRGATSGVWFLISGSQCNHIDTHAASNRNEESPEPLIMRWNEWAEKKATERSQKLGHTPERAAAWLQSLRDRGYAERRWEA